MGYRSAFEKYYDISIPEGYEIHHINLNHNDNDMKNLMILPTELHRQYHRFVAELDRVEGWNISTEITGNYVNMETLKRGIIEDFLIILRKCARWADYKLYLDGEVINTTNIHFAKKSDPEEWR